MIPIAIPYFIITVVTGFLAKMFPKVQKEDYDELTSKRKTSKAIFAFTIICVILIAFSAFRLLKSPANDEYVYRNRYNSFEGQSLSSLLQQDESGAPLLTTLFWVATKITTTNQGGLIITGFLTVLLILLALRRDAKNFSYAIILLMTMGYFFTTFNGIAQCLAAAIAFYSFKFVYEKKPFKFFLAILICCGIHTASIILFFLYFLCNAKIGSLKMLLWDLLFLISIIAIYKLLPFIIPRFNILTDYYEFAINGHHGVNIFRILASVAPAIIVFLFASRIRPNDRITTVSAHMTVLNALIYIASSMDVYIARFAIFTAIFVVIFLARILDYLWSEDKTIFKISTITLYSFLTLYTMQGTYYTFNFVW